MPPRRRTPAPASPAGILIIIVVVVSAPLSFGNRPVLLPNFLELLFLPRNLNLTRVQQRRLGDQPPQARNENLGQLPDLASQVTGDGRRGCEQG